MKLARCQEYTDFPFPLVVPGSSRHPPWSWPTAAGCTA